MKSVTRSPSAPVSIAEQCEVMDILGEGTFGVVKMVVWKDGKTYALKTIDFALKPPREKMALSEVQYSPMLLHENVIHCYAAEADRKRGKAYLLMEYAEGGDVADVLAQHKRCGTRLSLERGWSYFIQTANALKYLHDPALRGDCDVDGPLGHGDIKTENLLLCDTERTRLKLCDMGLMREYPKAQAIEVHHGTITYMAPEVWNEGVADERADCYSLGVVGFELLNGAHPFAGMKEDQLRDMHMKNSPCAKPDYERDSDFATLIDSLMCPDPDQRLTIADLFANAKFKAKVLEHEAACHTRALLKLQRQLVEQEARHLRACRAQDDKMASLEEQLAVQARLNWGLLEQFEYHLSERAKVITSCEYTDGDSPPLTKAALQQMNAIYTDAYEPIRGEPDVDAHCHSTRLFDIPNDESCDEISCDGTRSSISTSPSMRSLSLSLIGEVTTSEATWGSSISVVDLTDVTAPEPLQGTLQSACIDQVGSSEVALPPDAPVGRKGTRVAQLIADSKDMQYHTILHSAFQQTKTETVARLRRMLQHLGMSGA